MNLTKMKAICELEERHGMDLGNAYKNKQACATFVEYIAKEQQQVLVRALLAAKFYSFQCDGITDCVNAEDELILAVYFDGNADDKKVHIRNPFFMVLKLVSGDAKGIVQSIEQGMHYIGMGDSWAQKLGGFGTDGAAVKLAECGLKGQLKQVASWMEMVWCLAHRLELALKDALKYTLQLY